MKDRSIVSLVIVMVLSGIFARDPASAAPACVTTPLGIECTASGGSTGGGTAGGGTAGGNDAPLPLVRYLVTDTDDVVGDCWYWSRYGPGLDSWDAANDHGIILTRTYLPECPSAATPQPLTATAITAIAWSIFRSFPLTDPDPILTPWPAGYTGLASRVRVPIAPRFRHHETLPDGSRLRVRARAIQVVVGWGDDSPALRHNPLVAARRGTTHIYGRKTCSRTYRRTHPAGRLCHPSLAAYPVAVTNVWLGEQYVDGAWLRLGEVNRTATIAYDVDEIIGVPTS